MRVAFLLQGAPRRHELWSAVGEHLERRGARVTHLFPEAAPTDLGRLRVEHDVYVLKCGAGVGLQVAGALHALGAACVHPYPVVALCRDKVATSAVLAAAGVPVPETWVAGDTAQLERLLQDGPLVVKPHTGSKGVGVRVVRSAAELAEAGAVAGPVVAQRHHPPDGRDLKLYVIGGRVFGVRRVWPARTAAQKLGEPFAPDEELQAIAARCATALGIDTFGFDVVRSDGAPVVVDLSALPGFKGVAGADRLLADAIGAAA